MLKVGLIGCGFMGEMHANCYKNIEGVELAAVADIRKEKAEALACGTNAVIYETGKELIENTQVDIIDICLPTFLHCEHALLAMDKVKYVFVEKPVALTYEEAQEMIKKAEATGCNVQIGQVIRFWDEYVKLKELMTEGKLGKVINANFRRISPVPTWGWNGWLSDVALSGGAAQDLHVHDVDYVLSLFGEPKEIASVKNTLGEQNSYINSLLSYDDFVVTVEGTWGLPVTHPFSATFRVVFENGVLSTESGKLMLYTNDSDEEIKIEKKDIGAGASGGNISDLGGYYNELVYFTDCAKENKKVEKATLKDAAESLCFVLDEIKNAKN
ncbi:MAG: Gfo/Idh/MocA family oxidoreductase [Clostridia bacterium]|nr:Gfo/Idh/MocA family oxidoreductase [Clostridia bacterium]